MNIPKTPYRGPVDIIDAILVKSEASQAEEISLHAAEIPSLPQNVFGSRTLADALRSLADREIIAGFEHRGTLYWVPKLDKAHEKKLLRERQSLFERTKPSDTGKGELALKDHKVSFDDAQPAIVVGRRRCALPGFTNQHFLCRAMFERAPGEAVDWSLIDSEMTGSPEVSDANRMRVVQDAMYAVNRRIKETVNTEDDLFSWGRKTLQRNF